MRRKILAPIILAACVAHPVVAGDCARALRSAKGWTIAETSWVSRVVETRDGDHIVVLADGTAYEVPLLLLDPMPTTNVVVLTRGVGVPQIPRLATPVKLLIGSEVYDAFSTRVPREIY